MGNWLRRMTMIFGVPALPATAAPPQVGPSDFWNWFKKNQAAYFGLDSENTVSIEQLFDSLSAQLNRYDPDLVFEFSPVIDGQCEFVISAGGIKRAFPAVSALVAAAPQLPGWKITAFRPRRNPVNKIEFQGLQIDPTDVYVQIARDEDKLALRLFMPGYTENMNEKFGSAAYLLLDETLGEYDVETKIAGIDFQPLGTTPPDHAVRLPELPSILDSFFPVTAH